MWSYFMCNYNDYKKILNIIYNRNSTDKKVYNQLNENIINDKLIIINNKLIWQCPNWDGTKF